MDQLVEEFDSPTGTWVTAAADVVADVPASDLEETPVPEPEAAPVVKVEAKPEGKPRNDPKARVEAATAKEAAAKRERDEAKAEAAKLQARIAELEAKSAPKPEPVRAPASADAEPKEEDFADYRQFVKAQARWEAKEEIRQQETTRAELAARTARETYNHDIDRQFGERWTAVLTEDPDFPTKVDQRLLNTPRASMLADPSTATFGNFLVEQIVQSERPKELLLHLSDPSVVQRLATLPPARVIRELARFESSLGAASPSGPAPTVHVSHAKVPIRPVETSPPVSHDEPGDDASDDEWLRHERAAELKRRRAGRS